MKRRPEKISSLDVDRGLYVLRYLGVAVAEAPAIHVRPSPGSEAAVTIIACPGEPGGRLAAPGTACVILVAEDATLQVTAQAMVAGGSLQAEVRLEPLHRTVVPPLAAAAAPVLTVPPSLDPPAPKPGPAKDFSILAHVSRLGDVVGEEGVWIGGPDAPSPIEGLSLVCSAKFGTLSYQVLMAGGEGRWSDWLSAGSFAGSRGRAVPLTGLRIRFAPSAGAVSIEGEVLFLGSPLVRKEGVELEFRSAAGSDPLVGLRLTLKRASADGVHPAMKITGVVPQRVRVFGGTPGIRDKARLG